MKRLLAVLVVGLLLGADAKPDKLEGTWKAVKAVQNGMEQPDAGEHLMTFAGDTFAVTRNGETMLKGTFKTDNAKKPKTIDFIVKEGRHAGETIVAIYELDGDTLQWCAGEPGTKERPTEMKSGEGSKRLCVTLKREKK